MLIKIDDFEFTEVWDGVLYKKLSGYPQITDWEVRTLAEFMAYERLHGRECTIECEDKELLGKLTKKLTQPEKYLKVPRPELITECTACPYRKGCVTEYVCHTTSVENAQSILQSGRLLSAIKARKLPVEQLMAEKRNAANDPADYFEYVMLGWGNCQGGDRLVMERELGRFPDEEDISVHFRPGIRFYFRYDELAEHPGRVFDGVLPMKVKDEVILKDWVHRIIIPEELRERLDIYIPEDLRSRVVYVEQDCKDIWDWAEKVYRIVEGA